jgi:hypothetical protein
VGWQPRRKDNMTYKEILKQNPSDWTPAAWDVIETAFKKTHTSCVGGLYNPRVVAADKRTITIRCHYDNYADDDDAWEFELDRQTGKFF